MIEPLLVAVYAAGAGTLYLTAAESDVNGGLLGRAFVALCWPIVVIYICVGLVRNA